MHVRTARCWIGLLDVGRDDTGRGVHTKVRGKTEQVVRDKLEELHTQRDASVDVRAQTMTMVE